MVTRRDMMILGLAAPWLTACGGGGSGGGAGPENVVLSAIIDDDWNRAAPEGEGVAPALMQTLLAEGAQIPSLRSLLVVRNARLIGERYYADGKSSDLRHIRSATKTVSSLLAGQAIRDGKIRGATSTLAELLPREMAKVPASVAGNVTLAQVLRMRSGLDWDEDAHLQELLHTPDLASLALGLPIAPLGPNGPYWNYNSAVSHLVSPIVASAYGEDTLAVATRNLFEPLGIRQVAWQRDATGAILGSFGLQLRARDLMKLAWMALDGGMWQGKSVVPAAWLAESFTNHVHIGPIGDMSDVGYGYLWWRGMLGGHQVITAYGFGGQLAMLVPDLRMTIVTAALWDLPINEGGANEELMFNLIGRFLAKV